MSRHWTFGQKLGVGFAITVLLTIALGVIAIVALQSVVASKDRVILHNAHLLLQTERLEEAVARTGGATRGFLLTRDEQFIEHGRTARADLDRLLTELRGGVEAAEGKRLLDVVAAAKDEYLAVTDRVIALRRTDLPTDAVARAFDEQTLPKRTAIDRAVDELIGFEERLLEHASAAASDTASSAITLMIVIGVVAVLFGVLVAFTLARTLSRQIISAVGQVRSSSAELQAAANQQATGAKEQATAMTEIATTISELMATSRQIAESAQRVAEVAGQTAAAARSGDGTVAKAHDAITSIRRQVDLVVGHVLELGGKSQQIGAVLEIVSELAEQTNILAINATIEAAGAGDAGKRFAVVADEIRKLADRVAGSTKEIRMLIADVRSAVNTTVMATETGSKAVDTGARHFGDVAAALGEIGGLVTATTEAGREIELSTKQQSTAVEQVNIAIANVAQATKESEASSSQTLQTASQLAVLSKELLRLVEPRAAG